MSTGSSGGTGNTGTYWDPWLQVQVKVPPRGTTLRPQDPLTVTVTTETPVTVAIGAIDTAVLSLEPRHRLNAAKVTPNSSDTKSLIPQTFNDPQTPQIGDVPNPCTAQNPKPRHSEP